DPSGQVEAVQPAAAGGPRRLGDGSGHAVRPGGGGLGARTDRLRAGGPAEGGRGAEIGAALVTGPTGGAEGGRWRGSYSNKPGRAGTKAAGPGGFPRWSVIGVTFRGRPRPPDRSIVWSCPSAGLNQPDGPGGPFRPDRKAVPWPCVPAAVEGSSRPRPTPRCS